MGYLSSFEKAILFIENNLEGKISVYDVAKEAGYSYYHLTRLFESLLGESVGNYIQKRKLSKGAEELIYSEKKIIDIAFECGFKSPEAFSRAFKVVFKVSPLQYRNNRLDIFLGNKPVLSTETIRHLSDKMTVHPKIVEIQEIKVAGIEGSCHVDELPQLWNQFGEVHESIPNIKPLARAFSVCEPLKDIHTISRQLPFTETIGLEVVSFEGLPQNLVAKIIPKGKYAVFTHTGEVASLIHTYEYIWGTWLLFTKEQLDDRADFEVYDERFLGRDNKDSQIDIYLPIK